MGFLSIQLKQGMQAEPARYTSQLQRTPFVPIGTSLLRASRLFMAKEGGDLSLFMSMVPRRLSNYEALLLALGPGTKESLDARTSTPTSCRWCSMLWH